MSFDLKSTAQPIDSEADSFRRVVDIIEKVTNRSSEDIRITLDHARFMRKRFFYFYSPIKSNSFISSPLPFEADVSLLHKFIEESVQSIKSNELKAIGPMEITVNGDKYAVFQLFPPEKLTLTEKISLIPLWLMLFLAALISLVLSFVVSNSLVAPLLEIKSCAYKFGSGNLSVRYKLRVDSDDEIGLLSKEFNSMANRIEDLMASHDRLLSDVSHELISPLTRLSIANTLAINVSNKAAHKYLERIEKETSELKKLIDEILTLSRLETYYNNHITTPSLIRLDELLKPIFNDALFLAENCQKQLKLPELHVFYFFIDKELMRRAIDNLLRNAIKYAKREITVSTAVRAKNLLILEIDDDGEGVPEEELSEIIKPFYRAEFSRNERKIGYGLGLTIACKVIETHGGELKLANRATGGLKATICVPLRLAPSKSNGGKSSQ
jgi:two-component system sensor histidine kinase CpxA